MALFVGRTKDDQWKNDGRLWLILGTCCVLAMTLQMIPGWVSDLFSHFQQQYLAMTVVCWTILVFRRNRLGSFLLAIGICFQAVLIFSVYFDRPFENSQERRLRVLLFNLKYDNQEAERIRTFIQEQSFDVIGLLELTPKLERELDLASLGYPHSVSRTRRDSFGIGLYSRFPLSETNIVDFGEVGLPSITAVGQDIQWVVTHPGPPSSQEYFHGRNVQLAAVAEFAQKVQRPSFVMMDMNATPWSKIFHDFLRSSGLQDSRKGFGVHATWPTMLPLLWIPIDHVFVSPGLRVRHRDVGPHLGSDHYPVIVEL